MMINNWQATLSASLEESLKTILPQHQFSEVIRYSVFPTGKLFRPILVYALAHDIGNITPNHSLLASAIELHHTYTLIHDDLPAMDDDDFRRNRPSSHKKFSEWEAILAGDSLLSLSYEVLSQVEAKFLPELLKSFAESTGPRGLILGQVLDLSGHNNKLEQILKLHELKTARLIQLALTGSALLCHKKELTSDMLELGKAIGINFQLLDDLCELTEAVNQHEKEINPFIHFPPEKIIEIIKINSVSIRTICKHHQLKELQNYINLYYAKIKETLEVHQVQINKYFKFSKDDLEGLFN